MPGEFDGEAEPEEPGISEREPPPGGWEDTGGCAVTVTGGTPDCGPEEEGEPGSPPVAVPGPDADPTGELLENPIPGSAVAVSDDGGALLLLGRPEPEAVIVTGPLGAKPLLD